MAGAMGKLGMGWLPDLPDFRDYTSEQDGEIMAMGGYRITTY